MGALCELQQRYFKALDLKNKPRDKVGFPLNIVRRASLNVLRVLRLANHGVHDRRETLSNSRNQLTKRRYLISRLSLQILASCAILQYERDLLGRLLSPCKLARAYEESFQIFLTQQAASL